MTYSLSNLILFWEVESRQDFATIKDVLQIAGSENIPANNKQRMILLELKNSGLFEEEYDLSPEQEEMNMLSFIILTDLYKLPQS